MRPAALLGRGLLPLVFALALGTPGLSRPADHSPANLGQRIDDLTFRDAAGKPLSLHDLIGKKATVVVFLSFDCPMSTGYAPVLADLSKTYKERGVAFLGVSSDADADAAQLARQARDFQLPFAIFSDRHQTAAAAFQAEVTPEAFVLDADRVLRYRGRIDNGYTARLKKSGRITRQDLQQALDEVLAGRPVSQPVTAAVGCAIRKPQAARKPTGNVTFYRDVLPILQERCQACHRPGEVAPFSLMTYKQAVNWAGDIKEFTQNRQMPPWKPVAGGPFHGERKLTDRQIATLAAWVDGGTPAGDPKDAPPPRHFAGGWQLGPPDLVLTMPDNFQLGPSGPDHYRYFVLPTNLPADRYVTALEVRPGNRRIVHHAVLFADGSGRARRLEEIERKRPKQADELDRGPGYAVAMGFGFLPGFLPQGGLGGWAPGMTPHGLPDGVGYHLPRGADVILQLHYNRTGRVEKDRTSVGLYFAKNPAAQHLQGLTIPGRLTFIPAGVERYRVEGSIRLREDCQVHAVMPHMHLLGREIRVTMVPPDGPRRTLVAIKDWDFNWQETYFFKESVAAKAGTRFDVEGVYDNSSKNPRNPNQPPKPVVFGVETTNEMCVGFLGATPDRPGTIHFDIQVKVPGLDRFTDFGIPLFGL